MSCAHNSSHRPSPSSSQLLCSTSFCICPKSKIYFFIDLYQYLYFPRVVSFSAFLSSCSSSSIYKIYLSRFPKCIFSNTQMYLLPPLPPSSFWSSFSFLFQKNVFFVKKRIIYLEQPKKLNSKISCLWFLMAPQIKIFL